MSKKTEIEALDSIIFRCENDPAIFLEDFIETNQKVSEFFKENNMEALATQVDEIIKIAETNFFVPLEEFRNDLEILKNEYNKLEEDYEY